MNDFWFIMGAATIAPKLLDEIKAINPGFQRIGWTCFEGVGVEATNMVINPAAGYLLEADTTKLRELLRDQFAGPYQGHGSPPVISLYAAGKICQIWNTCSTLGDQFITINKLYQAAAGKAGLQQPTAGLATLIGVCLVDEKLCEMLKGANPHAMALEFGYNPDDNTPEWQTVSNFIGTNDFTAAQAQLLAIDTWDNGCQQTILHYSGSKRAAN